MKHKLKRWWALHHLPFITNIGIEFWYKGDTVIWLYPWERGYKVCIMCAKPYENASELHPWLSISFGATYPTLKAIDDDWKGYFETMKGDD